MNRHARGMSPLTYQLVNPASISTTSYWSPGQESNPHRPPYKGGILPLNDLSVVTRGGFEPPTLRIYQLIYRVRDAPYPPVTSASFPLYHSGNPFTKVDMNCLR